jgi:hypothetical protein
VTPLPNETILSTLAEMGIAVVGFALVGGILRPQSETDETRLVTLRGVGVGVDPLPWTVKGLGPSLHAAFLLSYSIGDS